MKRRALDLGALVALGTLVAAALAFAQPGIRDVVLHVYVLAVGTLVLLGLLAAVGDVAPRSRRSAFDAALAGAMPRAGGLAELERIEREVTLASASAYDLHRTLLPTLRDIAEMRLERTGRRLGPETAGRWWELLRPDRPAPEDRFAPGIAPRDLRALVDDLEKM